MIIQKNKKRFFMVSLLHQEKQSSFKKFSKNVVFSHLNNMKNGRLDLTLPSGEKVIFGDKELEKKAEVIVKNNSLILRCCKNAMTELGKYREKRH